MCAKENDNRKGKTMLEIVYRKTQDLIPYENNPRNNDPAVDAVAESIKEFGFKNPIIIDRNNVIVAGHTRIKSAKQLGIDEVPCVVADDLTDEQIRAFRLADNKTAEIAEWDFSALDAELERLKNMDMSRFGFDIEDESALALDDEELDEVPEPPKVAKTKRGDIYQLGDHRLMCGDSTNKEEFIKLMDGKLADMVFTDPPYGVAIGDKNKELNSIQRSGRILENIENDTLDEAELYDLLKAAFINVRENCKDDACYFVTSPQGGSLGLMMMMMRDAGLMVRHILVWRKNSPTFSIGRLDYDYQHEPIFYTWTKSHHNYRGGQYRSTIWDFDKPRKADLHPTMKPVELVANAILDGTQKGMLVLDAFLGSGTTIIAAEQTGRVCYGMELDPHYCDVIVERWENLTGKKAVLLT